MPTYKGVPGLRKAIHEAIKEAVKEAQTETLNHIKNKFTEGNGEYDRQRWEEPIRRRLGQKKRIVIGRSVRRYSPDMFYTSICKSTPGSISSIYSLNIKESYAGI